MGACCWALGKSGWQQPGGIQGPGNAKVIALLSTRRHFVA